MQVPSSCPLGHLATTRCLPAGAWGAGDLVAGLLWSLSLYYCSPIQLVALFFGNFDRGGAPRCLLLGPLGWGATRPAAGHAALSAAGARGQGMSVPAASPALTLPSLTPGGRRHGWQAGGQPPCRVLRAQGQALASTCRLLASPAPNHTLRPRLACAERPSDWLMGLAGRAAGLDVDAVDYQVRGPEGGRPMQHAPMAWKTAR
jgi:hypothetical protein